MQRLIVPVLVVVLGPEANAPAAELLDLDILYIGKRDSKRARDFATFLERHFKKARVAERKPGSKTQRE